MRIILADHHELPRWALKLLIEEQPGLAVAGEALEAGEALRLVGEGKADLVLVDQDLPGSDTLELISQLHSLQPGLLVVVMSSQSEYGAAMINAGADAFVSKMDQPEALLATLVKMQEKSLKARSEAGGSLA